MYVKIINGTYGHLEGKRVVQKTSKSEPFELDDEKAKRLLSLKIAERVDMPALALDAEDTLKLDDLDIDLDEDRDDDESDSDLNEDRDDDEPDSTDSDDIDYSAMSRNDLMKLARERGITAAPTSTKAQLIEMLSPLDESEEAAPSFDAALPEV